MFGLIVSGQLVQTNFEQVGECQFVTNLNDISNIKHIVVFLTGTQPFPENLGGSVYFSWPQENGVPTWNLLGFISNEKPSAIFKIVGLKTQSDNTFQNPFGQQVARPHAQVGISVEPLSQIAGQTPVNNVEPSTVDSFHEFSSTMCENLYNYASSFAQNLNQFTPISQEQYIPMSVLLKWYESFKRKLEHNPYFWKK